MEKKIHTPKLLLALTFLACACISTRTAAQYEANALANKSWFSLAGGVNNFDYWSWNTQFSYSHRSDFLLTQYRASFTQELIQSKKDTCTMHKEKHMELGVLWGDGFATKRVYFTATAGMALMIKHYCKALPYDKEAYVTGVTFGIPVQVEFGIMISKQAAINIMAIGNWNFHDPYYGALLGFTYRLKRKDNEN